MKTTYSNGMKIISNADEVKLENIPERCIDDIARVVLGALEVAVQNREFIKGYEAWKKRREEQK